MINICLPLANILRVTNSRIKSVNGNIKLSAQFLTDSKLDNGVPIIKRLNWFYISKLFLSVKIAHKKEEYLLLQLLIAVVR